jgi:hypothetical protein
MTNALILVLFVGCSGNFETKEFDGKLYRLNKKTGNVELIVEKDIVPLKIEGDEITLNSSSKNVHHWQDALIVNVIRNDTILRFFEYISGDPADSNNWKFIDPSILTRTQMDAIANQKPWVKFKRETFNPGELSKISTEKIIDSLYKEIKEHSLDSISVSESVELRILELENKLSVIKIKYK